MIGRRGEGKEMEVEWIEGEKEENKEGKERR